MARKPKTPKEEPKKTPLTMTTEDVDMDKVLADIPDTHGTGIQGYMRDKIKNATEGH